MCESDFAKGIARRVLFLRAALIVASDWFLSSVVREGLFAIANRYFLKRIQTATGRCATIISCVQLLVIDIHACYLSTLSKSTNLQKRILEALEAPIIV